MVFTDGVRFADLFVGKYFFNSICLAALLIGGVLSAVLTLTLKIHTEYYLLKRLAVIAAVIIVQLVLLILPLDAAVYDLGLSLLGAAAVIYQVLKVQNEGTSGGERAVMMLSDPILYWMIFWFLDFITVLLIT